MAIITKPATIEKNVVAEFSLNKSELANLSVVSNSVYYDDMDNWSKVILNYKSDINNQFHIVTFNATQASPTGSFLASEKSDDVYQILSIDIVDFDNGSFRIDASELSSADFEVDMGSAQSASPYNPLLISNQITLSNSNYTALSTDSGGYASMGYAQTNTPITLASGKFYKEFTLDATGLGFVSQYFGIRFFTTEPTDFTPSGSSSPIGLSDNEYQIYIQNGASLFSQLGTSSPSNSLLSSTQTPNSGDIIGIAIDADDPDKGMYFSINGVFLNNANPATGAGKIEVKTIFPSIPDSIKPFFFTQLMGQNRYTINATPSHLPAGYQAV